MPTVVLASPKGGVGKTTAALLLGLQLSKHYSVSLVDADPNRPLTRWASGGNLPANMEVVSDADENNIIERIEAAAAKSQ